LTQNSQASQTDRLASLDSLRGIAAILVVLFHYTVKFPSFYPEALTPVFTVDFGKYGVQLFFMISGFVILMSLNKSNGKGFVRSRILRLFPIYWISLIVTSLMILFGPMIKTDISWLQFAANMTMAHEYIQIQSIDGVYWSLTYELGFYFFMYSVFRLKFNTYVDWLPLLLATFAVLYVFIEKFVPHPINFLLVINSYGHLFAAGMAFYLIRFRGLKFKWIIVVLATPFIELHNDADGSLIIFIFIAMMGLAMIPTINWSHPSLKFPRYLGSISYALYVIHQMAGYEIMALLQSIGAGWTGSFITTLVLAIVIAHCITYVADSFITPKLRTFLNRIAPAERLKAT